MTDTKGHPLALVSIQKLITEHSGYKGGFNCDACGINYKSGSYHCSKCFYDLCQACYNKKSNTKSAQKTCPAKHALKQFRTPKAGYGCDVCKRRNIPSQTVMYGCRSCNYDLCTSCFTSNTQSTGTQPQKRSTANQLQKAAAQPSSDPFQDFLSGKNRKPIIYETTNLATGAKGMIVDTHSGSLDIYRRGDKVKHKKSGKLGTMRMVSAGRHLVHWEDNTDTWEDKKDLKRAGSDQEDNDGWNMANINILIQKYKSEVADEKNNMEVKNVYQEAYNKSKELYNSCWEQVVKDVRFVSFNQTAKQIQSMGTIQKKPLQPLSDAALIYKQAKSTLPHLINALKAIAANSSGKLKQAPLKKIERSVEKVVGNYANDWRKLTDIARASLIYDTLSNMYVGLVQLRKSADFTILRIKNRFDKNVDSAYRDCSMLVLLNKVGNKHVCEVQLHLKSYIDKKGLGGHMAYKGARSFGVNN